LVFRASRQGVVNNNNRVDIGGQDEQLNPDIEQFFLFGTFKLFEFIPRTTCFIILFQMRLINNAERAEKKAKEANDRADEANERADEAEALAEANEARAVETETRLARAERREARRTLQRDRLQGRYDEATNLLARLGWQYDNVSTSRIPFLTIVVFFALVFVTTATKNHYSNSLHFRLFTVYLNTYTVL
jgi:hypothetical protein